MTTDPHKGAQAPYWSLGGLATGARMCGAMVPGTVVFAAAYGTLAAQKGLTLAETVLMSALVFGGASQLVALEVWTSPLALSTVLSLAVVTAIVNARFILMGATLRPWAFIGDPKRFGFDLMLLIFFAAMFVPLWRGARRAIGWAIAGIVALAASYLLPGWWFMVIGALTGSIAGAFIDDE